MQTNSDIPVWSEGSTGKRNININDDERPSRFKVDLNFSDSDDYATELSFFQKIKNKIILQVKNYFRAGEDLAIAQIEYTNQRQPSEVYVEKIKNNYNKLKLKTKRLAFYPILKIMISSVVLVFRFIYKISHKLGWLSIFSFRLVFFLFFKIFKFVFKFLLNAKKYYGPHSQNKITEKKSFSDNGNIEKAVSAGPDQCESASILNFQKHIKTGKDPKNNPKNKLLLNPYSFKAAFGFSAILLLLILPVKGFIYYQELNELKGFVAEASEAAITDMASAANSASGFNFEKARESFAKAGENLSAAQNEIGLVGEFLGILSALVPNKDMKMAAEAGLILEAGVLSAEIGEHLSAPLSLLGVEDIDITVLIENLYTESSIALSKAEILISTIQKINPENLPDNYKAEFIGLKEKSNVIAGLLSEFNDILAGAWELLGFEEDKRYLLVFQNNAEIRASGGFIGSFAIVDFKNGKIKKMDVPPGGSYDTAGGLFERIVAPEPLHLINPLWHFWDANWWPDWPKSAEKLMWFYEKSGGSTVDGVISLTPTVMEDFLRIIGPVYLENEYDFKGGVLEINADNFWEITQVFSEQKPLDHPAYFPNPYINISATSASSALEKTESSEPKKIIGFLMEKVIEKISNIKDKNELFNLVKAVEDNFSNKQILINFQDEDLQARALKYGFDGSVKQTGRDYLMVVNTNIGGSKSDRKIMEEIGHEARSDESGNIIITLTIKRVHTGSSENLFTGARNVDWIRIYVPLGSELISAQGFLPPLARQFEKPEEGWKDDPDVLISEGQAATDINSKTKIYSEFNKTVFANWSQVEPGQTAVIKIKYRLPFKLKAESADNFRAKIDNFFNPNIKDLVPYSLYWQKQPGSAGTKFNSSFKLPNNHKIVWQYGENINALDYSYEASGVLDTDKYWAALMEID